MEMSESEELVNVVIEAAVETDGRKKLQCADAFRIAKRFDVGAGRIGRICNDNNIKICACQLGCFK